MVKCNDLSDHLSNYKIIQRIRSLTLSIYTPKQEPEKKTFGGFIVRVNIFFCFSAQCTCFYDILGRTKYSMTISYNFVSGVLQDSFFI